VVRNAACLLLALAAFASAARGQHLAFATHGATATEGFGSAIARGHDFDHDGVADLIVGATGYDDGLVSNSGAVAIVSGATGAVLKKQPGGTAAERLGASVTSIADVNGDGIPDVAAGAPGFGGANPAGAIRLLDGATLAPLALLVGPAAGARIGERVISLGDLDGDQKAELATGARGLDNGAMAGAGAVLVYSSVTGLPTVIVRGQAAFDGLGTSLARLPDVTSDLVPELIAGAPGADPLGVNGAGMVVVVDPMTSVVLRTIQGTEAGAALGASCAGSGDLDGDGSPEILAGAPSAAPNGLALAGSVFVHSMATGAQLRRHDGLVPNDQLGTTLTSLGDLDRDGKPEYAIGSATTSVLGLVSVGAIDVIAGNTGSVFQRFEGGAAGAQFGGACANVGDLNGDARPDFVIGWPAADVAALDAGAIQLRYGQFPSLEIDSTGQIGTIINFAVQGEANAPALLLVDVAAGNWPSPFGTICVGLTPIVLLLPLGHYDATGNLLFFGAIPSGVPSITLWLQVITLDAQFPGAAFVGECESIFLFP
jgi:hypothetical protein